VSTRGNTRGVVYVHSSPSAVCPHVEWAISGTLGTRVDLQWTAQPAAPGQLQAQCCWTAEPGTGGKLVAWGPRFSYADWQVTAATIDVDAFGRIGVVAGRNDCAIHGIHCSGSSISLARKAAHAAVAKISTASRGISASLPAIQYRPYSCAAPSQSAAVTPGRIGRSTP